MNQKPLNNTNLFSLANSTTTLRADCNSCMHICHDEVLHDHKKNKIIGAFCYMNISLKYTITAKIIDDEGASTHSLAELYIGSSHKVAATKFWHLHKIFSRSLIFHWPGFKTTICSFNQSEWHVCAQEFVPHHEKWLGKIVLGAMKLVMNVVICCIVPKKHVEWITWQS